MKEKSLNVSEKWFAESLARKDTDGHNMIPNFQSVFLLIHFYG